MEEYVHLSAFGMQLRVSSISAVATRTDPLQGWEKLLCRVKPVTVNRGKKEDGKGFGVISLLAYDTDATKGGHLWQNDKERIE